MFDEQGKQHIGQSFLWSSYVKFYKNIWIRPEFTNLDLGVDLYDISNHWVNLGSVLTDEEYEVHLNQMIFFYRNLTYLKPAQLLVAIRILWLFIIQSKINKSGTQNSHNVLGSRRG